jgi:hypothetical protein
MTSEGKRHKEEGIEVPYLCDIQIADDLNGLNSFFKVMPQVSPHF